MNTKQVQDTIRNLAMLYLQVNYPATTWLRGDVSSQKNEGWHLLEMSDTLVSQVPPATCYVYMDDLVGGLYEVTQEEALAYAN